MDGRIIAAPPKGRPAGQAQFVAGIFSQITTRENTAGNGFSDFG
jgi:hypothetical protein